MEINYKEVSLEVREDLRKTFFELERKTKEKIQDLIKEQFVISDKDVISEIKKEHKKLHMIQKEIKALRPRVTINHKGWKTYWK